MITIRVFKATDEPETCERFLSGHRKVLEQFNLENITTNTPLWITHENTYVIVAEKGGELLGGVRMQIADGIFPLPVEDAVGHMDEKIYTLVADKMQDGGACELCGLWNSRSLPPSLGLTAIITYAAVSIAEQINTKNVFAICAGYTLFAAMRMGMRIEKSVGKNGEFVYPNSNYTARVLCMNGYTFENSNAEFKKGLLTLKHDTNHVMNLENDNESIQFNLNVAHVE